MMVPKLLLSLWLFCMVVCGSAGKRECRCVNPFLGLPQKYLGERDFICKAKGYCFVECGSSCSDVKRAPGYFKGINRCTSEVPCALKLKYEDETTSPENKKDLKTKTTTAPLKEILTRDEFVTIETPTTTSTTTLGLRKTTTPANLPPIPAVPDRTLACQPSTEIQPRNITRARLSGEDFYISWSDCKENHCRILLADQVNCIYEGVCDDDLESKVGITGCEFEELGVLIQSKVLGDWVFITKDDMAFKIPEDEEKDYLNYPDYNFEGPFIDSDQDIATSATAPFTPLPITATSTKTTADGSAGTRECRCVNPFLGLPQKYLGGRDFICKAKGYCFVECGTSCSDVKRATGYFKVINRCTSEVPCALELKYEDETTSTVNEKDLITKTTTKPLKEIFFETIETPTTTSTTTLVLRKTTTPAILGLAFMATKQRWKKCRNLGTYFPESYSSRQKEITDMSLCPEFI